MAGEVILCEPCLFVETETVAVGFCGICVEYLCAGCINDHKKAKMTRSHKIQKENIPRNAEVIKAMNEMKACQYHKELTITYRCIDHDVCVCTVCRVDTHRKCENVFEIAKTENADRDLKEIQKGLSQVMETETSIRKRGDENKTNLYESQADILNEQEAIIQRAIDLLEELKGSYRKETNEKMQSALFEIEQDIETVEVIEKKRARNQEILEAALKYDDENCAKVIAHLLKDKVGALGRDVKKIQQKGQLKLKFEGNPNCIAVSCLGTISVTHGTENTERERALKFGIEKTSDELLETDLMHSPVGEKTGEETVRVTSTMDYIVGTKTELFNVKLAEDTKLCSITGSVVLQDGKIVIIDTNNSNIKLLSPGFVILDILRLPGQPIRICAIGNYAVAVSFGRVKRINRYIIEGNMISYDGGFATTLFNNGISFDGSSIVAIMSDVDFFTLNNARENLIQVEVRSVQDGNIIDIIRDFRVASRTSWPFFLNNTQAVCITADNNIIIAEMNRVLSFALSKELTKTVAKENNCYVCSGEIARDDIVNVTSDSDSVYVCTQSGSVLQISLADFETNRIILSEIEKTIKSVTVDNINNRIILGCEDDYSIHVCSFIRNTGVIKHK